MKTRRLMIVLMLVCFASTAVMVACIDDDDDDNNDSADDDDDDDDNDNDDSADDDNDADDDDDDDNDDATDDDNDDDNDTGDDDDDTPTVPTRLFLIGRSSSVEASWLQTEKGWQYMPIPEGRCLWDYADRWIEATATWNGEKAWVAWNCYFKGYPYGHDWKTFNLDYGWQDAVMDAMPLASIRRIYPVERQHVWFLAEFIDYNAWNLVENRVLTASRVFFQGAPSHYWDLSFPDSDHGLTVGEGLAGNGVLGWYDADQTEPWTATGMPTGHEDEYFWRVAMTSPDHGWAISSFYWLFEYDDGQWTHVNMPSGCQGLQAGRIAAQGDDVVVLPYPSVEEDRRFVERREGQWTCREAPDLGEEIKLYRPLVCRDGTVFIYGRVDDEPTLFQVTADDIVTIEMPNSFTSLYSLNALGPNAPWVSSW